MAVSALLMLFGPIPLYADPQAPLPDFKDGKSTRLPLTNKSAGGETIVTHETERYFYRNGHMEKFDGQFEYTYLWDIDKNVLVRTRIYDYQAKKITPDETIYQVENQLRSHPVRSERYALPTVIRAFGQTGVDSVELLSIEDGYVTSVKSTSDEIIVSRAKRLK